MRRSFVALATAALVVVTSPASHAEEPPPPRTIAALLEDARPSSAANAPIEASPADVLAQLYERYASVLRRAGAASLTVTVTGQELLTLDEVGDRTPADLLGDPGDRMLAVTRQVLVPDDPAKGAVRYVARVIDRRAASPTAEEQRPLRDQLAAAARRDGEWREVDRVSVFDVAIASGRETLSYRGLVYWLASARNGFGRFILYDPNAELVTVVAAEKARVARSLKVLSATPGDRGELTANATNASCFVSSANYQGLGQWVIDSTDHVNGHHETAVKITGACSTNALCISTCDLSGFDTARCEEWGGVTTSGYHTTYTDQKLVAGTATTNGTSTCSGAVACAVESCVTRFTCKGIKVTLKIGQQGFEFTLGGEGASHTPWSTKVTDQMVCPAAVPRQTLAARPIGPYRPSPNPPSPGGFGPPLASPGGGGNPAAGHCESYCEWVPIGSGDRYTNSCWVICR